MINLGTKNYTVNLGESIDLEFFTGPAGDGSLRESWERVSGQMSSGVQISGGYTGGSGGIRTDPRVVGAAQQQGSFSAVYYYYHDNPFGFDTDPGTPVAQATLNLTVLPGLLPGQSFYGRVGDSFSQTPQVSGTLSGLWAVTKDLPPGLAINANTGLISGIPTAAGSFSPIVSVGVPYLLKKVAVGRRASVGLKEDGTIVQWGDYPPFGGFGDGEVVEEIAISGGGSKLVGGMVQEIPDFMVVLKGGRIYGWGTENWEIDGWDFPNVIGIAAGEDHALAVNASGQVKGWGSNTSNQSNTPDAVRLHPGRAIQVVAWGSKSAAFFRKNSSPPYEYDFIVWGQGQPAEGTRPEGFPFEDTRPVTMQSASLVVAYGESGGLVFGAGTSTRSFGGLTIPSAGGSDIVRAVIGFFLKRANGQIVLWDGVSLPLEVGANFFEGSRGRTSNGLSSRFHAIRNDGLAFEWQTGGQATPLNPAQDSQSVLFSIEEGALIAPIIASGQSFSGKVGEEFSQTPNYTGIVSAWSATGLPSGLAINGETGLISGTPTTAGSVTASIAGALPLTVTGIEVAAGGGYSLALNSDGTVVGLGLNNEGVLAIPVGLSGVVAIAAGRIHSLALKSDGTVVGWGSNEAGQVTIPAGLSGVVGISAGGAFSLALKSNGTVVGWGQNFNGQVTIPSGLSGVVGIAAGGTHSLALKSDGTVVAWGRNNIGQVTIPSGLSGVVGIAAGELHSLALKSDGTVVGWGSNFIGQVTIPSGLSGVVGIAAGELHSLALKSDGTVVGWGQNSQVTIPSGLSGVVGISAGREATRSVDGFGIPVASHSLALKSDGSVVGWGGNEFGQTGESKEPVTFLISSGVPIVTPGQSLSGKVGEVFSQSLALEDAANRPATSWTRTSGTIPAGLTLDTATGVISGTPTAKGAFTANFTAAGAGGTSSTTSVSFTIAEGTPQIAAGQTLSGTVGTAFNRTPALTDATNRPVTSWSVTGLPAGLAINATTGAITGTPQDSGSTTITLTATGPGGADTETAVISIALGPPIITAGQGLSGKVGEAFSQSLALEDAADRPATSWTRTSGTIPAGLTLDTATGAISGTPTTKGSFTASFAATGAGGTSSTTSVSFTIAEGAPQIAAGQTLSGAVGTAFNRTPALANATNRSVTSWAAINLPSWATLNTSTGAITGAPDSGSTTITLTATGPGGSDTETAVILIAVITAGQSFSGKVGEEFLETPAYTGAISLWSATGLPSGLSISAETGLIFGTPTTIGSVTATLEASSLLASKVAAGRNHSLALMLDGTVIGWGANFSTETNYDFGQVAIPNDLSGVVEIAAGYFHSLALKSDGTVVAWGRNNNGQATIPSGLSGVVGIAAAGYHSLALKSDGTVVGWGSPPGNASDYPIAVPGGLSGVVGIAAGYSHVLALKSDGIVVGWGDNFYGQASIPSGLSGVIRIAAGDNYSLALKNDGTVVGWGWIGVSQVAVPSGLSGVVGIAAGGSHSMALKSDGTVVAWGRDNYGQVTIPNGLSGVVGIAAGWAHSLALKSDGEVIAWGWNENGQAAAIQRNLAASIVFSVFEGVPFITSGQTFSGIGGVAFSATPALTDSANRPVTNWAVTGLPSWATLNTSTGAITGTPQNGASTITLTAEGPGGTDTETATISIISDVVIQGVFAGSGSLEPIMTMSALLSFSGLGVALMDAGASWNLYREIQPAFSGVTAWGGPPGMGPGFVTIDLTRFVWGEFHITRGFTGRARVFCYTTLNGRITPEPLVQVGVRFLEGRGAERLIYRAAFMTRGRPFDYTSISDGESVIDDEILIDEERAYGVYNIWATEEMPPGQVAVHFSVNLRREG